MEQNNQRNSRKRLNSLILLVAFTAVMLIVSTYAWFSTQKNVTLGGLTGEVNVAEGLQISLDALNWKNEIDLSSTGIEEYFKTTNEKYSLTTDTEKFSLSQPYALTWNDDSGKPATYYNNTIPGELLPASTIGSDSIDETDMTLYRGENTDGIVLSNIHAISDENDEELGYYAIDFYLQNSSSSAAITAGTLDKLQLETNSSVTLSSSDKYTTGLQNSLRVAFVLFETEDGADLSLSANPNQTQIIAGTDGSTISDVAIWEPNASGDEDDSINNAMPAHVEYIVQNNNRITWSIDDYATYLSTGDSDTISAAAQKNFAVSTLLPTYALTSTSTSATYTVGSGDDEETKNGINNIYNWATNLTTTGLTKQNTVATTVAGVTTQTQLKSATDGTTDFALQPGEYCRLRMYVWLEGQDVDCINYASLGGDITLNIGLSKPGTQTTTEEDDQG